MSLSANIYPATMALVGNPVKLTVNTTSSVVYTIHEGDVEIYTGSGEGVFYVFIQDVLATVMQPVRLYNESPDFLLHATGSSRDITISLENDEGDTAQLTIKAVIGGVSKRTLRRLNDANSNIFTYKLLNSFGNFFQTSRTTSRVIQIRETELLPIQFLYPDNTLKIVSDGIETMLPGIAGDPMALNLHALRKKLFKENDRLLSIFDVYAGEHISCRIVITPGTVSRERYLLEFLNSYGIYERIEVTGVGEIEHESVDDSTYMSYDVLIDDYVESRPRVSGRDKMLVDTGARSPEEMVFLIDMLSSDDVRILGLAGRNIKVNVSAENLTMAVRQSSPESLKLTLVFAESESYHTGSLLDDDFGDPRIHTEQFTQEIN
jgi:hypothetical protein